MRRSMRSPLVLCASFVTVSCTLPTLDLTGKECPCADGFTCDLASNRCVTPDANDTAADAGLADAIAPDASSVDATVDAALPSDSGSGTVDAADGAPGTFCASQVPAPTFCADFDTIDLPSGWDSANPWGKGQLMLDDVTFLSPPHSIYFMVPATTGTDQGGAYVQKKLAAPIANELDLDFDFFLEKMDTTSSVQIAVFDFHDNGSARDRLYLNVEHGVTKIQEQAYPSDGGAPSYGGGALTQPMTIGSWNHVTWKLTRTATTSTSNIKITSDADGGVITNYANLAFYRYNVAPLLQIGLTAVSGPNGAWGARLDNVVLNAR